MMPMTKMRMMESPVPRPSRLLLWYLPKTITLFIMRMTMVIMVEMMPTKMMLVISRRVSRLRMCVSSCPMTPASSSWLRRLMMPVVSVTV